MYKRNILTRIVLIGSIFQLTACSTLGYLAHTTTGHLGLMQNRQPIEHILKDDDVSAAQKEKLNTVLEIRAFASNELKLPENKSYTTFVQLNREFVTWAVFAAPELSMQAKSWCFLVVGCVPYRGYFNYVKAQAFANELKDQGFETYIAPIPAYSTLGWFSDPLLSSMLNRGEIATAEYVFHELAHQKLYIKNDTKFNEAFASAIGHLGVIAWLSAKNEFEKLQKYRQRTEEKKELYKLIDELREDLKNTYNLSVPEDDKIIQKQAAYEKYELKVTRKIQSWDKFKRYQNWLLEDMNNAKLNALSTYQELVPKFIELFNSCEKDFIKFYQSVEHMKKLSDIDRVKLLNKAQCS